MLQGISTGGWYNQPSHVVHHGNQRLFTNISASALINWQSRGLTEGHNLISGVIASHFPGVFPLIGKIYHLLLVHKQMVIRKNYGVRLKLRSIFLYK